MIVIKPWGSYNILYQTQDYLIKEIIIKPKQSISLQYHEYRDETWKVISGEYNIEIDDVYFESKYNSLNEPYYIKKLEKHRITNISDKEDLVFIEIQTGDKLSETDIVRLEDKYGRS